jgi:hypothetical protein
MNIQKPTRIVKEPYRERIVGYGHKVLQIECDNGKTYSIYLMAKLLDITPSALFCRIRQHGWDSPFILQPRAGNGLGLDGKPTKKMRPTDNGPLCNLSNKPRTYNLAKIPPLGTYEQRKMR